jgi:hypothetical protein
MHAKLAAVGYRRTSIEIICLALLVLLVAQLGGCAIKLVPDYDKAIVDGLTNANESAMTLFATVTNGAIKKDFAKREDTYNNLIGKFDAVRLQIVTRTTPVPSDLVARLPFISPTSPAAPPPGDKGNATSEPQKFSTVLALETIIDTFTKMRERDRSGQLIKEWVDVYKSQYVAAMSDALTVEKALQR